MSESRHAEQGDRPPLEGTAPVPHSAQWYREAADWSERRGPNKRGLYEPIALSRSEVRAIADALDERDRLLRAKMELLTALAALEVAWDEVVAERADLDSADLAAMHNVMVAASALADRIVLDNPQERALPAEPGNGGLLS